MRSSRTKACWAVDVSAGDNRSLPTACKGMLLPLAAIIVGPLLVALILVQSDWSELATKEPVAPESKIAYVLEDWGETNTQTVEV